MLFARRLYLYFIATISLTTLAIGLSNLLELLFRWVWERINDVTLLSSDPDAIRRQLSVHVALVMVSLPIWLLHWWLIERSIAAEDGRSEAERRSAVRDLYLAVGLTVPFIFWVVNAVRLVERTVRWLLGVDEQSWFRTDVESTMAILVVTGAIWGYHAWTRMRDERFVVMDESSDWLLRLYLLGAAATGVLMLVFGLSGILALTIEATFGDRSTIVDANWWSGIVADSLGAIIVGLVVWLLHWGFIRQLLAGTDWRAHRLAHSTLLFVYVYAVALIGVLGALLFAGSSLQAILNELLGGTAPLESFAQRVLEPIARSLPFVGIWLYHRLLLLAVTGDAHESTSRATLQRIYTYAIALVGLGVGAFGIASVLYVSLEALFDNAAGIIAGSQAWRTELSQYIALAVTGTAAWLWHWYHVQRRIEDAPEAERGSTPRRVYLLAVIASAVIALLGSLAVVLYRLLATVLDVADANLRDDLSAPVAIVLVAAALLAYHGLILRSDIGARPEAPQEPEQFTFTVMAPAGTSEADVAKALTAVLPPGFRLRSSRECHQSGDDN